MEYPDFTDAACKGVDTNLFYVSEERSSRELYPHLETLKKICSGCPVKATCLSWALHHEYYGVWAGTTEKDRNYLRAKLGIKYVPFEEKLFVSRAVEGAKTRKERALNDSTNS